MGHQVYGNPRHYILKAPEHEMGLADILLLIAVFAASAATAIIFRWLRVPLWPLTGGLVGAATVQLTVGSPIMVPGMVALTGQLIIGAAIGSTIGPSVFRQFAEFLTPGLLAVILVIGAGVLFGWLFLTIGLLPPGESFLALLPGGVGEMVAASIALGLDSAVVVGAHVVRLLTVIWTLPLFLWAAEKIYHRRINGPD